MKRSAKSDATGNHSTEIGSPELSATPKTERSMTIGDKDTAVRSATIVSVGSRCHAERVSPAEIADDFTSVPDPRATRTEPTPHYGTEIAALDAVTGGGLSPGDLWLFVGAPGEGRSTLLTSIAGHLAREHRLQTYLVSTRDPARVVSGRLHAGQLVPAAEPGQAMATILRKRRGPRCAFSVGFFSTSTPDSAIERRGNRPHPGGVVRRRNDGRSIARRNRQE